MYGLPLRSIFHMVSHAGFSGLELVAQNEVVWRGSDYVNKLAQTYRLPILTVHQALFHQRWKGVWAGWILDAVDLALRISAQHVVLHGPEITRWESPLAKQWLLTLEMALRRLNGSGIRIAMENDNWHSPRDRYKVLANLPDLVAFAEKYDLDLTFDTCHAVSAGVDILAGWSMVSNRCKNIHFSDFKPGPSLFNSPLLRSLFQDHQLPGRGVLPLVELVKRLDALPYTGALTMEVSPVALQLWAPLRLPHKLATLVQFGIS
jgi:sugar phosphate isomerase/epimerase